MFIVGATCADWEVWLLQSTQVTPAIHTFILFQLIHTLQLSMNTLYNVWYITYHYNNNIITMQLYKFFFCFAKN